jgi:signal transduction histidine kinase
LEASESERARWARELHDETLQELAGLSVLMSTVDRTSDSAQRVEAMAGARAQLGETIRNLRHLISDLRPAALDELGIDPAVEALVERIASGSGLEITVQSDFDFESGRQATRIEPQFELTIYRLVQEALTNVIKHAQAEHAKVELREVNGVIELTVSDDGIGFDPFVTTEGFGLLGMRERAAIANGSFEVQSGSTGTSVHARISAPHRLP